MARHHLGILSDQLVVGGVVGLAARAHVALAAAAAAAIAAASGRLLVQFKLVESCSIYGAARGDGNQKKGGGV